jgi:hypothetical protein
MDTNPNRCRRFPIIGVNWGSFVVEKLICLPPILKYKDSSLLVGKFAVSVRVHYFQRSDLLGLTRTMVKKISKVLPTATHCDFWSAVASLPPAHCLRLRLATARQVGATSGENGAEIRSVP